MRVKELETVKLIAIVSNDLLKKSDSIVCLEGDDYNRIEKTARLFKKKLARNIVVSGGYDNPPFSIPAKELAKFLVKKRIPLQKIILEEKSQNTHEQALEVMKLAKKKKWKKIILVASHFHQPRAYLTFLKAMKDLGLKIQIFNVPVRKLPWLKRTFLGKNRLQLLEEELKKIEEYRKKGQLATIKEAISYQKWKEREK